MSKNVLDFNSFTKVFEFKKEKNTLTYIIADTQDILNDMFATVTNAKYKVGSTYMSISDVVKKEAIPTEVMFDVVKQDYNIGYDEPLQNEFSEGVLKKREKNVELIFKDKKHDEKENKYTLIFTIKLSDVNEDMLAKARARKAKFNDEDEDEDVDVEDNEKLSGAF